MADIINIQHYTDALRNTGYKNTESALAEIIDNSIEAEAKNILIICSQTGRNVTEIAILDNGDGMNPKNLENSLSLGQGTKKDRKGMGRFGVGLPQASLHVSPRVEVYSWQKNKKPSMTYLDVNEIEAGKQKEIPSPTEEELPKKYKRYLKLKNFKGAELSGFEKSGTLVVWKKCDRLSVKTIAPLFKRFEFLLGRKFRNYIEKGCTIGFALQGTSEHDAIILPNDPLYLMQENQVLGKPEEPQKIQKEGEPIFEPWENGDIISKVKHLVYYDKQGKKQKSSVDLTFSIAKEVYQKPGGRDGGQYEIGKHCARNVGISIVRAEREIMLGEFDYYSDTNEPQHRWWGCEIKFSPELDEAFGVANNKQYVELEKIDNDERSEYEGEDVKPMWLQLEKLLRTEIKNIYKEIKSRGKSSRGGGKKKKDGTLPEESTVDAIEKENTQPTQSAQVKKETSQKELEQRIKEHLIDGGDPNPSPKKVKGAMNLAVKFEKRDLGSGAFIDVSTRMGNCWITINENSEFYRELYSKIEAKEDEGMIRAFNLMLMAYARAEDEAVMNFELPRAFRDVREKWAYKIREYLESDWKA